MARKVLFLYNENLATEALLGEAFAEQGFDVDVFEVVPAARVEPSCGGRGIPRLHRIRRGRATRRAVARL